MAYDAFGPYVQVICTGVCELVPKMHTRPFKSVRIVY